MNLNLVEVNKYNENQLEELFQVYVLEMTKYLDQNDDKNRSVNAIEILKKYWENQPNWPYFITANGEIAGFCLLRRYPGELETIDIDQYYVCKKFRRQGVGVKSLAKLIKIHPGNWLIRVLKTNTSALGFWVKAVEGCVGTGYKNESEKDDMHFIRFSTKNN